MAKTKEEKKEAPKKEEPKPEPKVEKEDYKIRHLTEDEQKILMDDAEPAPGYTNVSKTSVATEEPKEEKKPGEAPPEPSKEAPPAPKEEPVREDFFERLEREASKPEGREDLSKFTPREKAYFYQMKKDRKLRQQAEEERDKVLFKETQRKLEEEKKLPEKEDPFKVLEGKDPEDFLTVKEVKEILAKKPEKQEEKKPDTKGDEALRNMQINYLRMCERDARAAHPEDFDAVMELSDDLITNNPDALKRISEKAMAGDNPALVMYDEIKVHKDFEILYPAAEIRAKAKKEAAGKTPTGSAPSAPPAPTPEDTAKLNAAKEAEKALETNTNRPKTTAHVSGFEGKPAEELTIEEIGNMSDLEFARLPRHIRQRYLRKFGSEPATMT